MNNIYFLNEIFTSGFKVEVLDIISVIAVLCGILVIIIKNPVLSVLFLIGLFLSIASYLMVLGLNFIGLSYLLVYVGAVSILFLFILMLINVRVSELVSNTRNSIVLAIFISISFNFPVYEILPYSIAEVKSYNLSMSTTLDQIMGVARNYSDFLLKILRLNADEASNDKIFYVTSKL
jgi:NADH-ubiquinone oxidoreductase chain 6